MLVLDESDFNMNDSITVQEQRHQIWKTGTIVSGLLCIVFFAVFWYLTDPFWVSIVRLCAFIFFAAAVLGYLKLMDGPLHITLSSSEQLLLVAYQKKGETIQEEQFDRTTIEKIVPTKGKQNLLTQYLQPDTKAFEVIFNDSDRDLYLFEFGGRPLLFDRPSQEQIKGFLRNLEIDF